MRKYSLLFVVLTLFAFTCEDSPSMSTASRALEGTWLLFESGYSPGDRYIVEEVDAHPAQTITFRSDSSFTSSVNGWEDLKFFRYSKSDSGEEIISFFEKLPQDADPDERLRNYNLYFDDNGNLELSFRFCNEGCHLKFRKVGTPDKD